MMIEELKLDENYLRELDVNDPARKVFLAWHSQITSDQVIAALKKGAFDRALRYALHGQRFNPVWLMVLMERLAFRGAIYFHRHMMNDS